MALLAQLTAVVTVGLDDSVGLLHHVPTTVTGGHLRRHGSPPFA